MGIQQLYMVEDWFDFVYEYFYCVHSQHIIQTIIVLHLLKLHNTPFSASSAQKKIMRLKWKYHLY